MRCSSGWICVASHVAAVIATVVTSIPILHAATLLDDMQVAFRQEVQDHVRYLSFARRADAEGYRDVARLFRAAAREEAVHAAAESALLRAMRMMPQTRFAMPKIGTTRANLRSALGRETWERDTMYPAFIEEARREGNDEAVRSLSLVRDEETQHIRLFAQALSHLDRLWAATDEFAPGMPVNTGAQRSGSPFVLPGSLQDSVKPLRKDCITA